MEYPFLIRGPTRVKLVKVIANSYQNALNKVLYKFRNRFIKTQFAKRMVLLEAKAQAQKESKGTKGKPLFVYSQPNGECDFSFARKDSHGFTTHAQFVNGKEVKLDAPAPKEISLAKTIKQTNQQIMAKSKKEAPAKKVAAKKEVKKIAGAKEMKAVALGKAIQNGELVFTAKGRRLSPNKLLKTNKSYQVTSKKNKEGVMEHHMHKG